MSMPASSEHADRPSTDSIVELKSQKLKLKSKSQNVKRRTHPTPLRLSAPAARRRLIDRSLSKAATLIDRQLHEQPRGRPSSQFDPTRRRGNLSERPEGSTLCEN